MNKRFQFFCLVTLILLVSCSSEKPGDKDALKLSGTAGPNEIAANAPVDIAKISYSLEIFPAEATRKETLNLKVMGFNLPDAKMEWLVNGKTVDNPFPQMFNTANTKKGDSVQARALIQGKEILSNKATIKNTPPEIQQVRILPEVVRPGDTLSVDVMPFDIDGDNVTIAYEWTKNGEPAGIDKKIEGALKRGDKISIKITPFDGESYGPPAILKREIMNMAPVITENNKYNFDGKVFTYQIVAADPDKDPLAYSLKSAPAGMTINQGTGLITWKVPADFKGETSFVVVVTDDKGSKVTQSISFKIIPAKQ